MLGDAGASPIVERDQRGWIFALSAAVLLAVGSFGYWWLSPTGALGWPGHTAAVHEIAADPSEVAPIMDQAGLLSDQTEAQLTAKIVALKAELGPEMVVLTVVSLNGQSIEDYALNRGNQMGIGDRARNDGVLIVVAPNEKKVRIELGRGLTTVLSNETCAGLIAQMLPQFKANKFDAGVAIGVDGVIDNLRKSGKFPARKAA